jgi:ATP-binding cassette, subfamily B, bacterial
MRDRVYSKIVCLQFDSLDCGPTCLEMICRFHRVACSRSELVTLCDLFQGGSTFASLARAARLKGFRTLAVKITLEEIRAKAQLPAIAFLPGGHYVVMLRVTERHVLLADPISGLIRYTHQEFTRFWTLRSVEKDWGALLLLTPPNVVKPERPQVSRRNQAIALLGSLTKEQLTNYAFPLLLTGATALFGVLAAPALMSATLDFGLLQQKPALLVALLSGQLFLLCGRAIGSTLDVVLAIRAAAQLEVMLSTRFMNALLLKPLGFFDYFNKGDMLQRLNDHKVVQSFMTESIARFVTTAILVVSLVSVLAWISTLFLLVFICGYSGVVLCHLVFQRRINTLNQKLFRLYAGQQLMSTEVLSGIRDIKLAGVQASWLMRWSKIHTRISENSGTVSSMNGLKDQGSIVIAEAVNLVILWLSCRNVISGQLSLGSLVAVQFLLGQLSGPLQQTMQMLSRGSETLLSVERTADILTGESDSTNDAQGGIVAGDIRFANVTFTYPGQNKKALNHVCLFIPEGQTTAIVGASGSGKSTLLKLLLQYYKPSTGTIMMGDHDLLCISASALRAKVAIVSQDAHIFADTIANNITLRAGRDEERLRHVVGIAQLERDLSSMPRGVETTLGSGGLGLSKGQLQRVLLARALYQQPDYLLLDEPTSALDSETEAIFMRGLRDATRGKTVVIVAHRLSTIKFSDQIIVLNNGSVVEQGTHETLLHLGGRYADLLQAQL